MGFGFSAAPDRWRTANGTRLCSGRTRVAPVRRPAGRKPAAVGALPLNKVVHTV